MRTTIRFYAMLVVSLSAQSTSSNECCSPPRSYLERIILPFCTLSLKNSIKRQVHIFRGINLGGTPHPADNFRFVLEMPNGRQVELFCTDPNCGSGLVAGSVGPYTVNLEPNQVVDFDIALAKLAPVDGDGRLCRPETKGAFLGIKFSRETWPGNDYQLAVHDSYWTGVLSGHVALSCPSRQRPHRAG